MVALRGRMRWFRTHSRDFTPSELVRVRDSLGQVYIDVSSKLAPDDFAADLRKLKLARECLGCERHGKCPGLFLGTPHNVFAHDDEELRALLRQVVGRVLDVGCGEGPYADELAARAEAGELDYLGIDPDAERVALLGGRHSWAHYRVGTLTSLDQLPAGQFDHVLMLRSYNHLPDPAGDMTRAVRLLAPGGSLLIADNVAYGLVRSSEQASRAETSSSAFEHYRNDSAAAAVALASELPLQLLQRREVGPETSNQWLLHYRKEART